MAKTILILGASYAGLTITHKLLKHTLKDKKEQYKVVIVSPTTHHYWNLASVRAIVPGQIPDSKLFASIPAGLAQYKDAITLIIGAATELNPTTKTVTIRTALGKQTQAYDILVVATGSRSIADEHGVPWKLSLDGYEATKAALHKIQERVKAAKSIVLGGGGPTGIETAGELGFEYGQAKEITLITSASQLLPGAPFNVASFAEAELQKLNVKVIKDSRVSDAKIGPDGRTELTLSNDEKLTVDLYLPTMGVIPNTEFAPKSLLNENGDLVVDDYLRVKNAPDVWAAGDVIDLQPSQYVYMEKQAAALAKNLDLVINGKPPVKYKYDGAPMMAVTLGRSRGTGRYGSNKLPSKIIWFAKGRTLGTQNLQGLVSGSAL